MNATTARLISLAAVLALVVLLTACSASADSEPDPAQETPAGGPPAVDISSGNDSLTMGVGSSCWTRPGTPGLCIDKIGIMTPQQPFSVSRGANLTIENPTPGGALDATISAFSTAGGSSTAGNELAWRPTMDRVDLQSTAGPNGVSFAADLPPGRYVLSAFFVVPQGDVSYGVVLEVR